LLDAYPFLLATVTGLVGLVVGSFLNVVIYRLPVMMERDWKNQCREMLAENNAADAQPPPEIPETFNLATPRSACRDCGATINALQNIPVLSYLLLKGRCASCGTAISARYPLIEAFTAIVSATIGWRFGLTLECAGALILCWSLICLTVIDIDHQLLPDSITLPLLWLGLGLSLVAEPGAGGALFPDPRTAIIGAIAGYLSLWTVYQAFKLLTGKEGMGYGDFKLFAALGAWLGWQMLPLIILLSAVVGSIVGIALMIFTRHGRQVPIPFGPYLAAAGFVAMLWGPQIVSGYLQFLRS
jgi:leader peptidase (prepilin peptidase)/N-methyltransferase